MEELKLLPIYEKTLEGELKHAQSNLRRVLNLFKDKSQGPRLIRRVCDIYEHPKMSQWILDLLMRTALNSGNWVASIGSGLYRGYLAFQASRDKFRAASRMRPPIYVPESKARKDLEYLLMTEQVKWRD